MTTNRQLAAIMFTDIVGYTAMMNENEVSAARIRERHREIFEQEHARYHGELLQYYGDGSLSIFSSAVQAVACAIKMQQEFQTGQAVPLRIGLHLGDIVRNDDDIYGDGVNVASRIESLGVSGCVLISDHLRKAIQSHPAIQTKSLGSFEFKNVKESIEVHAVCNHGIEVPDRSVLTGKLASNNKSIAVLPFVNMSADPENEYFSDGIAEEILNALVRVEGLKVTARTSSFSFKGKNLDVRDIGSQLGVQHILEGSVRKSGNRVRITAQLVSSVDGYHFFSETYDRTLEDIFAVQDEIAQKITNRLREHLSEAQYETAMVSAPTANMEAYETYLQGVFYANQWDPDSVPKAITFFEKAIEMQPDFGLPRARLALCYFIQAFGGKLSMQEAYRKCLDQIHVIKRLGIETPEAYFALTVFELFYQWNWAASIEAMTNGLRLFPNYSSLHHAHSTFYYITGDLEKAIETHIKGLDLDPLSIEMIFFMGIAYLWNGDYDKAVPFLDKVLEIVPAHRTANEYKGWIFAFQENYTEALSIFLNLEPEAGFRLHRSTCLGWVYFKTGEKEKAMSCLDEIIHLEKQSVSFAMDLVVLYTCFGDQDNAFLYLEKAIKNKVGDSMMIVSDIFLVQLRDDPRFKALVKSIGEVPPIHLA